MEWLLEHWYDVLVTAALLGMVAKWAYENLWQKEPEELVALVTEFMMAIYGELRERALALSVEEIEEIISPWYEQYMPDLYRREVSPSDIALFIHQRLHSLLGERMQAMSRALRGE